VGIITSQRQLILMTQREYAHSIISQTSEPSERKSAHDSSPLAKFLAAFKYTIQKIIERVGHYL